MSRQLGPKPDQGTSEISLVLNALSTRHLHGNTIKFSTTGRVSSKAPWCWASGQGASAELYGTRDWKSSRGSAGQD